jgi:hypothetical protein
MTQSEPPTGNAAASELAAARRGMASSLNSRLPWPT